MPASMPFRAGFLAGVRHGLGMSALLSLNNKRFLSEAEFEAGYLAGAVAGHEYTQAAMAPELVRVLEKAWIAYRWDRMEPRRS